MQNDNIYIIGSIVVPIFVTLGTIYITNRLDKTSEKSKRDFQHTLSINQLKEKWLNYVRENIEEYISLCFQMSSSLREEKKIRTIVSEQGYIVLGNIRKSIIEITSRIEAKETRIKLLFKKDSKNYAQLKPILSKMVEVTGQENDELIREQLIFLEEYCQDMLYRNWKLIEGQREIEELAA